MDMLCEKRQTTYRALSDHAQNKALEPYGDDHPKACHVCADPWPTHYVFRRTNVLAGQIVCPSDVLVFHHDGTLAMQCTAEQFNRLYASVP